MIKEIKGDIFKSQCDTIVNPVNCVGISGKGLALTFRNKFPIMYEFYKNVCKDNSLQIGNPILYESSIERNILLFPTVYHYNECYGDGSKIKSIELNLDFLISNSFLGIKSIAFPKVGCGCGKLNWSDVRPIFYNKFNNIFIYIELYI